MAKAARQKLSDLEQAARDAAAVTAAVEDPELRQIAYAHVLAELLTAEYVNDLPGGGGLASTGSRLATLRVGYARGELTEPLMIDNDSTTVYHGDEEVFAAHPDQLLEDALDLLGIPHEHV